MGKLTGAVSMLALLTAIGLWSTSTLVTKAAVGQPSAIVADRFPKPEEMFKPAQFIKNTDRVAPLMIAARSEARERGSIADCGPQGWPFLATDCFTVPPPKAAAAPAKPAPASANAARTAANPSPVLPKAAAAPMKPGPSPSITVERRPCAGLQAEPRCRLVPRRPGARAAQEQGGGRRGLRQLPTRLLRARQGARGHRVVQDGNGARAGSRHHRRRGGEHQRRHRRGVRDIGGSFATYRARSLSPEGRGLG
jgi:hypothetical protein